MTASKFPPRALVVEDEFVIALDLEAQMQALGFNVFALAASASEALTAAKATPPDIAIMDIYLNGARDGIEAARQLRELYDTTVVFVTSYGEDPGLSERIEQQLPGAKILSKPLYGDRLANAIAGG
jgi:CheY-like chemotaxis protein